MSFIKAKYLRRRCEEKDAGKKQTFYILKTQVQIKTSGGKSNSPLFELSVTQQYMQVNVGLQKK